MADTKISLLNSATSVVGTEVFPLVQTAETKKITFNAVFAAPPAIGGTTPAAGAFTTVSATGEISSTSTGSVFSSSCSVVGTPSALFQNTSTDPAAHWQMGIRTGSGTAGDPSYALGITGVTNWTIGIDNSDSQKLKISNSLLVGTSTVLTIDSTGLAVTGEVSGASRYATGNNVTDDALFSAQNTGGTMYFGVDNSIGSFTGGAYGNFWYGAGSTPMTFLIGGTSRATVSATGLAVTGAISSTGNLTVSGGTITTGSTTALSLATSGGTQVVVANTASAVNYLNISGGATGTPPYVFVGGTDTDIGLDLVTKGTGDVRVITGGYATQQLLISHTASADRYITLTGSNGGNPTIGTSAGGLTISSDLTVSTGTITTGSTTALSLATSGGTQAQITNTASAVNYWAITGSAAAATLYITAAGTDTNIPAGLRSKGTGGVFLGSTLSNALRAFGVSGGNRTFDVTNSNGGNITIGTSAGNLAISSAIVLPASTTSVASANLPHGSAPTSPVDGDMWTTTSGLYVRINGVTVGPLS